MDFVVIEVVEHVLEVLAGVGAALRLAEGDGGVVHLIKGLQRKAIEVEYF